MLPYEYFSTGPVMIPLIAKVSSFVMLCNPLQRWLWQQWHLPASWSLMYSSLSTPVTAPWLPCLHYWNCEASENALLMICGLTSIPKAFQGCTSQCKATALCYSDRVLGPLPLTEASYLWSLNNRIGLLFNALQHPTDWNVGACFLVERSGWSQAPDQKTGHSRIQSKTGVASVILGCPA